MTVEMPNLGGKNVVVGIKFDGHAKQLLHWAVTRVAGPGDSVVAIHVCRNSGCVRSERALLDGYLEDYQALCKKKQVALTAEVIKGNSIRKVLVREARNRAASDVIIGIAKHSSLRGVASLAKFCTKRLSPDTEVMAVYNGEVVFSRCAKMQSQDDQSEIGESEELETNKSSFDGGDGAMSAEDEWLSRVGLTRRGSLSAISLPVEDFTKHRPGWPLLQTSSSTSRPVREARKMSVVQWVMQLPRRSESDVSESGSDTRDGEDSMERKDGKLVGIIGRGNELDDGLRELQRDLRLMLKHKSVGCYVFSFHLLRMSTSNFSSGSLIGKGGYNSVYKGILPDGKPVAVKVLKSSKQARKDFMREVDIMTTLKHARITPLLGICTKDNKLISVYDYLAKGSLEENLHHNRTERDVLPWEVRFKIAVGIAEALNYLHNECPTPIIHRDIKSSNVLLTDDLEPQLCDFGLAIWGPMTASFLMDSDVVGTFGYLAPEYFMYGKVSDKIDVYAFGVVLLELLSGRKPIGMETIKGQESLVMWAKPKLESGDLGSILDPSLEGSVNEAQMQRMALAATLCLSRAARLRPKMDKILGILHGDEHEDDVKLHSRNYDDSDDNDDEVYPDSSAESHLNLALLDLDANSASFSSLDQRSPLSVEEFLKKRWRRSSSLE